MKCRQCENKAVARLRAHKLTLCKECYPAWFEKYTQRSIEKYKMFTLSDKILIAVSGGKDSLALWSILKKLGYDVSGLYIHLGIHHNGYSDISLQKCQLLAEKIDSKLFIVNVAEEFGHTIPEIKRSTKRAICSVCGTIKRYYMNRICLEHEFSTIATGHNLDDEAAALLGNTLSFKIEYLSRQHPVLEENIEQGLKKKSKPFCYFSERDVLLYCLVAGIDFIHMDCPYSDGATSITYKEALNHIEENSPGTKRRFYDSFLKNQHVYKYEKTPLPVQRCTQCTMSTQAEICSVCRMKNSLMSKNVS